jgi:flagellar basal body-associated protein FliL
LSFALMYGVKFSARKKRDSRNLRIVVSVSVVKSVQEPFKKFMKRVAVFILILLGILLVGGSGLASAHGRTSSRYDNRAARKANRKQQKAQKKYAKAQRKAERKMLKTERKNTTYPTRKF